VDVSITRWAI